MSARNSAAFFGSLDKGWGGPGKRSTARQLAGRTGFVEESAGAMPIAWFSFIRSLLLKLKPRVIP